ncbi:MAG: hypothetical protein ACKO1M_04875 [Planctomycetota bacterium]
MPIRSSAARALAGIAVIAATASAVQAAEPTAWPPPPDRVALLPPVEFNLEESLFAGEPIADADSEPVPPSRPRRGGGPFGSAAPVSLGGFWAPATDVVGQPATLGMNAQFARVAAPLVPPREGEPLWIGIGRFGRLELATDAILPDSNQPVPDQLWLVETGVTHIRPLDSGGTLGGTFLFGSASDRPFAAGRDLTLMAIAFWNTPAKNERDEWNFSIFYSPTSQLPYPLPGLAYAWRPSDAFEAKLGVPASFEWRPDDAWTISAAYFPLVNVNVEARRKLAADWSFVAFYRTDTQIYFLADRVIDDERFYVFDQRAALGFERALGGGFTIEALASWLFDRELFQGTNFTSGRTDVVEFDPGPGLSLQLLWRR